MQALQYRQSNTFTNNYYKTSINHFSNTISIILYKRNQINHILQSCSTYGSLHRTHTLSSNNEVLSHTTTLNHILHTLTEPKEQQLNTKLIKYPYNMDNYQQHYIHKETLSNNHLSIDITLSYNQEFVYIVLYNSVTKQCDDLLIFCQIINSLHI